MAIREDFDMETDNILGIIKNADVELQTTGIDGIANEFGAILDEFVAIVETFVSAPVKYKRMLDKFVIILCERFGITRRMIYVRGSRYSTDMWGPLFWKFFHYSSILVTYMYSRKEINDMLDFPIIVYNINHILPCSICRAHYLAIKSNDATKLALKEMAFGNLMSGLQMFHNLVTANIDSTPPHVNRPPRAPFSMLDFAKTYKCLELTDDHEITKSLTYIRNRVDWQPTTHRLLSVLYALAKNINYRESSNRLKSRYREENLDEIARSLEDAVTLNIDASVLEANAHIIEGAIVELRELYPKYLERLVRELPESKIVNVANKGRTNKEMLIALMGTDDRAQEYAKPSESDP